MLRYTFAMNIGDIPTAIWILAGFGLAGAVVFALMVFGVIGSRSKP